MTLTTDPALAAARLAAGGLVAFPTETVYGLGAHAELPDAVARIFAAKGRPSSHPVIVHIADAALLERYAARIPQEALRLAEACWPGPLTMILPRTGRVPDAVTGGRDTVGVRVPDHPLALRMLEHLGAGVAAPSANPFGRTSPTTAQHVVDDLGDRVDVVLDGGACSVGLESTIVDLTGTAPAVLRLGALDAPLLSELLGVGVLEATRGPARAPGMLASHYSPAARVEVLAAEDLDERLTAATASGHTVAVMGLPPLPQDGRVQRLQPSVATVAGYAHDLYAMLRRADTVGADRVFAIPPPPGGLGDVVRDRLARAAAD